ncbi:Probable RNA-directed DNA polymerase from transposon BS [Eumeta japonica]|uniref:Probable RNA-directed DNA polymerase from transposon BS n=1 Tax=Eumeta variegata TaxID=151549 RepID=A0A4C1XJ12_EUMVA|nr:Probable RNA-directed DNA polymerase from transposon BS [Eumeta japonica]
MIRKIVPPLCDHGNSIPEDINTTDEIDSVIGILTNHVKKVVAKNVLKVPASSKHRKLPADVLELVRAKNAALRRASAYPRVLYRSRVQALQHQVRIRIQEVRNENWSDLMEEITPTHKAFWKVTKTLKSEGYVPIPPLKKPNNTTAIDDAEIAECIADNIETQCSHACPAASHFTHTPYRGRGIHKPRDLLAGYRPISLLSGLGKLYEKILKSHLSDHLFGKGHIINQQLGFRPAHSYPQEALRLVEYIAEGFKTKQKTVAIFFDVTKAFDRDSTLSPLLYSARTNNSEIPQQFKYKYLKVTLDRNLHFKDHIERVRKTVLFYRGRSGAMLHRKSKLSLHKKRTIYQMCIRCAITYASPVFAHAVPKALNSLQVIQNKFCRLVTDAHWCVRNSVLHRDLEYR